MTTMRFRFNVNSGATAVTMDTRNPGEEDGRIRDVIAQCRQGRYGRLSELVAFSRRVPNVQPLSFYEVEPSEFERWQQEAARTSIGSAR